jgi:serine/threonine protein kinase
MNIEPVPVTSFQHEVPPGLDAIISRAIAKDPDDRYQSGAELAQDLQKFGATDDSLTEATSFFARAVSRGANHREPNKRLPTLFLAPSFWIAAIFIIAAALTAVSFRWMHELRAAADLNLPDPPVVSAPAILKSAQGKKAKSTRVKQAPVLIPQTPAGEAAQSAEVEVEILHHFKSGKASIWLDDELVFDRNLRGTDDRHPLFRTIEMSQVTSFHFPAGRHVLQVRVLSPANMYDQIENLDADFSANSERVLVVNCDKRKMQVALQ